MNPRSNFGRAGEGDIHNQSEHQVWLFPERGCGGGEGEPEHAADDAVPAHVLRDQPDEWTLDDGAHAANAVHQAVGWLYSYYCTFNIKFCTVVHL